MTRPPAVLGLLLALAVAGCNSASGTASDTAAPTTTGPASTTTEQATSTTAPPSTTTESPPTTSEPPATTTTVTSPDPTIGPITVDDWEAIIETIAVQRLEATSALDVSQILDSCVEGSQCATVMEQQISSYVADGLRPINVVPTDVLSAEVISTGGAATVADASLVRVRAVVEASPAVVGQVVDAEGNVAYDLTTDNSVRRFVIYTLLRFGDPLLPWRLSTTDSDGPVEE